MLRYDISLVWFRRDLRCFDHAALHHALVQSRRVYCAFIFDTDILDTLPRMDRRVEFIRESVAELDDELRKHGGAMIVRLARAVTEIPNLARELGAQAVFTNHDYEPAAISRDAAVAATLEAQGCDFLTFKDQVIFEKNEVLSQAGKPFSVFTPYKNAWLRQLALTPDCSDAWPTEAYFERLAQHGTGGVPTLEQLGFEKTNLSELRIACGMQGADGLLEDFSHRIADYANTRDYPAVKGPSYLSLHLRFGTVSVRALVRLAQDALRSGTGGGGAEVWLSELIWRDFYAMILFHHPHVVNSAFKPVYEDIVWEQGKEADALFAAWCEGRTGYPLVDAAMLQLNRTGYMHNRLRMVTASFLCKDLGIAWQRGEAYFAEKLNDFDLASNNGGWQWAASSGCDAQPYFRIFNPITQSEKFDPKAKFIKRYLPQLAALDAKTIHAPWRAKPMVLQAARLELGHDYPMPIVDHDAARKRTLARYGVVRGPQQVDMTEE
ncbi:MAG: deoxyribodipyrimidine photo-lyase [Burkholderiaceae bacterium]|nr:deoxyribodipyrimidine photo-lyase [Burkholderiaceae bacterium]